MDPVHAIIKQQKQTIEATAAAIRDLKADNRTQQERIDVLQASVNNIERLKEQLEAQTRVIRALEAEKCKQTQIIQELHTNIPSIGRLKHQMKSKTRAIKDLEAEKVTQQERIQSLQTNVQQLEAKTHTIGVLEAEKRTQQEMIQQLHLNVANLSADQQRNVTQLKESLSLQTNDNSQRFAWLRSEDDEKKENDLELVKIVADNPIRIAFVDGKQQKSVNDALSSTPPVNSIDDICACNKQILNGVKLLMKDVSEGRDFVYSSDFDRNGICCALGTHFGTKQWRNPMELGLITVHSSSGWEYGQAKQVVAREVNGK
eukprot:1151316_1